MIQIPLLVVIVRDEPFDKSLNKRGTLSYLEMRGGGATIISLQENDCFDSILPTKS